MRRLRAGRWVPNYAIYKADQDGEPALVVTIGFDDKMAPNRKTFRNSRPKQTNDEGLVEAFSALARPTTTIDQVAKFIVRFGSLGGLSGHFPQAAAERFAQATVPFESYSARLVAGFGAPSVSLQGEWPIVTVSLYQRVARFISAVLRLDSALKSHGHIRWEDFSKRRDISEAISQLEAAGFRGANTTMMAAIDGAEAPADSEEPEDDDLALYLAKYTGDQFEKLLRPLVETSPGQWERTGPLDARGRKVAARVMAWRKYWAALERAQSGKAFSPVTLARFKKKADVRLCESAAKWLISAVELRAELVGTVAGFTLRYAATTCLQAIAIAVAGNLVQSGGHLLRGCRLCGSAFTPSVGPQGGRPRSLCDNCYDVRTSKTVSARVRRAAMKDIAASRR